MITNAIQALTRVGQMMRTKARVGQTPHHVARDHGNWRLLRFLPDRPRHRRPILMVPSMINRWYVLDLMPGRSLVEYLVDEGFTVDVIDWGAPRREDRYLRLEEVAGATLGRAIRASAQDAGADRPHVLGYCMGGTLTAMHAAVHPEAMASLTTLAAPVRAAGILADWTRSPAFDARALVDAFGNVPWPILQASFLLLRPTLTPSKVAFLWDRAIRGPWNEDFIDGFLAKEKWANDNVSMPGEVFRAWVEDIYRDDMLVEGGMRIDGIPVRLEQITTPLHALTFADDYIVPEESAEPLVEMAASTDKVHLHLPGGHVGAVVSKGAKHHLWPLLSSFWADRDEAPKAQPLRSLA
ncbi:MAG: hypothetical protein CMN30_25600 [Sandaracinus sp.]|nr:hypothetical protein [Sandaracinus sp.]